MSAFEHCVEYLVKMSVLFPDLPMDSIHKQAFLISSQEPPFKINHTLLQKNAACLRKVKRST